MVISIIIFNYFVIKMLLCIATLEDHFWSKIEFLFTDKALGLAFKSLKKIENLKLISLGKVQGSCFKDLHAPNLYSVSLKYCENVDDSGISALVQNCQGIRSLNLFACSKLTDVGIEFVAGYLLGRLVKLCNCLLLILCESYLFVRYLKPRCVAFTYIYIYEQLSKDCTKHET